MVSLNVLNEPMLCDDHTTFSNAGEPGRNGFAGQKGDTGLQGEKGERGDGRVGAPGAPGPEVCGDYFIQAISYSKIINIFMIIGAAGARYRRPTWTTR